MRAAVVSLALALVVVGPGCAGPVVPEVKEPRLDDDVAYGIEELEASRDAGRTRDGLPSFLRAADPALRRRAALALGRIADEATYPALRAALTDGDPTVRAAVAFALGVGADEGAGADLARAIAAEADAGALAAELEAMGRVGTAEASLPILGRALADGRAGVREGAARGLLFLSAAPRKLALDAAAASALASARRDPALAVRFHAVYALSRAPVPEAALPAVRSALREALADDTLEITAARLKALARVAEASDFEVFAQGLSAADWRVQVEAVRGLGGLGAPGAERLVAFVDGQTATVGATQGPLPTAATAAALPSKTTEAASSGATASAGGTVASAPAPGASSPPASPHPVAVALEVLRDHAGMARVQALAARLAPRCDAVAILQRAGQRAAVLACDGPALRRKMLHAEILASLPALEPTLRPIPPSAGQTMAPPLDTPTRLAELTRLARDPDPRVRAAALAATAEIDSVHTAAILRPGLREDDMGVVAAAADGIKRNAEAPRLRKDADAVPPLLAALTRFKSHAAAETVIAVIGALGALGDARAVPMLRWAREDSNWTVRRAARAALLALGDKDAPPAGRPVPPGRAPGERLPLRGQRVLAEVGTTRGTFVIEFFPAEAPFNVANIVFLGSQGYFAPPPSAPGAAAASADGGSQGLTFHRVVPDFVVQGGDPRGDGYGGPGYVVPCELGPRRFERGAVGIALAGRDTGGSQLFVTHTATPHLDGRFTVIGQVRRGQDVVDRLVVGDRFTSFVIRTEPAAPAVAAP